MAGHMLAGSAAGPTGSSASLTAPMSPQSSAQVTALCPAPSAGPGETYHMEIHQSATVIGCGCAAAPAMTAWCLSGKEVMFLLEDEI